MHLCCITVLAPICPQNSCSLAELKLWCPWTVAPIFLVCPSLGSHQLTFHLNGSGSSRQVWLHSPCILVCVYIKGLRENTVATGNVQSVIRISLSSVVPPPNIFWAPMCQPFLGLSQLPITILLHVDSVQYALRIIFNTCYWLTCLFIKRIIFPARAPSLNCF